MADKDDPKDDGEDKARLAGGGDELPEDVEELKKLIRERDRKLGQITNDRAAERKARQAVTERAKVWLDLEEAGHSPEEIRQILEQRSAAEVEKAKETGNIDKLIANARKQAEKERDEAREQSKRDAALVQRVLVNDVVKSEFAKYIEPEYLDAVFSWQIGKFTSMEDPDDEYGRRAVVKVGDDYMAAAEWIKQFVETDDAARPFLKRSLAAGGGAGGSGGKIRTQLYRSEMSATEKSRFIRQHPGGPQQGMIAYNDLPWAREKKAS